MMMSGCIALSVIAVSVSVSPLRIEEEEADMFITSAPSLLPASSKDACVRVETSKKRLICVRPRKVVRFFSTCRFSSTNSSAKSNRPEISSRLRPSIPNRCRLLRTKEDFGEMVIKGISIGGRHWRGKAAGSRSTSASPLPPADPNSSTYSDFPLKKERCQRCRVLPTGSSDGGGTDDGTAHTRRLYMRNIAKFAAAATFAGALALSAATPSQAAGGRNAAAAIGFGAGALVGAAVASSAAPYYGGYYGPGYAYAPGYGYEDYAYDPGYAYGPAPAYSYAAPAPAYTYAAPAPAYTYAQPRVSYERSYAYSPGPAMAAPAQCWVSTDSSRGYGYYGSCASNNKDTDAGLLGQARRNVRAVR